MTWPVVRLSEVASIQLGKMLSQEARQKGAMAPYLRNLNVQWGRIDRRDLLEMSFDDVEREKFDLRQGDVLVCEGGEPGRCAVVDQDLNGIYFQKALMRVRPSVDRLDSRFLQRYMAHSASRGVFASGGNQATIAHFPAVRLAAFRVPLPELSEQKHIADKLDKADSIRRKRKEAITLTDDWLHATFFDMFGDPVQNPRGWATEALGALVDEFRYGTSDKCSLARVPGALPVLRIPNVANGVIDWNDLKFAAVQPQETERLLMRAGDLLFVRSNGNPDLIGRCAVFDDARAALFASYLIRARMRGDSSVAYYLRAAMSQPPYRSLLARSARTTAGNYNISVDTLRRLVVPMPPERLRVEYMRLESRARSLLVRQVGAKAEADTLFRTVVDRCLPQSQATVQ